MTGFLSQKCKNQFYSSPPTNSSFQSIDGITPIFSYNVPTPDFPSSLKIPFRCSIIPLSAFVLLDALLGYMCASFTPFFFNSQRDHFKNANENLYVLA